MTAKEQIVAILDDQPDDSTCEELLRELVFARMIDRGLADRHIRVLRYGHYRIAYLLKPGGDVDVLGVFHERLDIRRYLDE